MVFDWSSLKYLAAEQAPGNLPSILRHKRKKLIDRGNVSNSIFSQCNIKAYNRTVRIHISF